MKRRYKGQITYNQAIEMLKKDDILLIDVKSTEEYKKFHLKNSINIPIEHFNIIAPKIIKDKNKKIIIYCSSGIRSLAACEMMRDLGYKNVFNILGGIKS